MLIASMQKLSVDCIPDKPFQETPNHETTYFHYIAVPTNNLLVLGLLCMQSLPGRPTSYLLQVGTSTHLLPYELPATQCSHSLVVPATK
jgi:hypothetical protein